MRATASKMARYPVASGVDLLRVVWRKPVVAFAPRFAPPGAFAQLWTDD